MRNITFEFLGGPKDGEILEGALGEPSDAERYYLFSNHGAVGQRFRVASPHAIETLTREKLQDDTRHGFQQHYYVVTDRFDDGEDVRVRAEYVPDRAKSSRSSH